MAILSMNNEQDPVLRMMKIDDPEVGPVHIFKDSWNSRKATCLLIGEGPGPQGEAVRIVGRAPSSGGMTVLYVRSYSPKQGNAEAAYRFLGRHFGGKIKADEIVSVEGIAFHQKMLDLGVISQAKVTVGDKPRMLAKEIDVVKRMTLDDFAAAKDVRNIHIFEDGIEVYVRRGVGFTHNADFELAALDARKPGTGALTRFLDRHEPKYTFYIENILEPRLVPFLEKRGYRLVNKHSDVPDTCMITASCKHYMDRHNEPDAEAEAAPTPHPR